MRGRAREDQPDDARPCAPEFAQVEVQPAFEDDDRHRHADGGAHDLAEDERWPDPSENGPDHETEGEQRQDRRHAKSPPQPLRDHAGYGHARNQQKYGVIHVPPKTVAGAQPSLRLSTMTRMPSFVARASPGAASGIMSLPGPLWRRSRLDGVAGEPGGASDG